MEFCRVKNVVPRKVHVCAWCGERCEIGEPAIYRAYHFDGRFQDDYLHPECFEALGDSRDDIDPDEGFSPGEFKRGKTIAKSMD